MQSSYWGYWLVVMGVAIIGLMISVQGLTTNTNQNYLSTKEIVEASMLEAVDYAYYRDYNEVKMNKEKFMEVFIRMLSETMSATDQYEVNFYGIYEAPPKASVEVKSNSGTDFVKAGYDTVTRIDAIIQIHAEEVTTINQVGDNSNSGSGSNGTGSNSGSTGDYNSGSNNNTGSNSSNSGSNSGSNNPGNNGSNNGSSNNSGSNNESNSGSGIVADVCKSGIKTTELKGMHGTAMLTKPIYETSDRKKSTGNAKPGIKFDILGENGNYWAINYEGKCGWIDSTYMAINMAEYIKDARFSITNASSSIYKSSNKNIAGLTGKKLYSSEYTNSWVPGTFSFAKKLKVAAANAKKAGDTIVINDAYRPSSVSKYANNKLTALYNSDKTVKANIDYSTGASGTKYSWGKGWFLASNVSTHNTGCAVDASLSGKSMPTAMHELSALAIKYYSPNVSHTTGNYSVGVKNNTNAQRLSKYMMDAGLADLASEWWHYQDNTCHKTIGTAANFWSAV